MLYFDLLSKDLIQFVLLYNTNLIDLLNFVKIYKKIDWRQIFNIKFPLINFNYYFVNIDFNSKDEHYYVSKFVHLNKVYTKWISYIKTKDNYNKKVLKSLINYYYSNKKIEDLSDHERDDLSCQILSLNEYCNHIPDIRIFTPILEYEYEYETDQLLIIFNEVERYDEFIIRIYYQFELFHIEFEYLDNSYDIEVNEEFVDNFTLYLLYNNVPKYIHKY